MNKWETVSLGDVCLTTENENPTIYDKTIFYIDISAINSDIKKITVYNVISSKVAPSRARQRVQCGDILVSTVRPNLNAVAIVDKTDNDMIASTGFCVLRPDKKKIDNNYLFEFVKSSRFVRSMTIQATGASYPAVSNRIVMAEQLPLPPLSVQQKIADVLGRTSVLIEKRKAQIEKLNLLVKSRFIEMFGDPVQNSFNWKTAPMEVVAPVKAFRGVVEPHEEGYWLLNLDMIESQTGRIINKVIAKQAEIGNSTVAFGSENVLYSKLRPYLNKVALPDSSGYVTTEMLPLLPDKEFLNNVFLAVLLRSNEFLVYINDKVAGTKMPRVQMDVFRKFQVILPPVELQKQFSMFVRAADKSKFELQCGLDKLELLYKSLMQKCFDGEEMF